MARRVRSVLGASVALAAMVAAGLALVSNGRGQDKTPEVMQTTEGAAVPAATAPTSPDGLEPAPTTQSSPLDRLKISAQSWRRGGLGSKALVTFTLRNTNDFAVKDIEIACAFTRRNGMHLTERKRLITETVNMKSRKTFTRVHVGFVNVNADKAKCTLLTASRV